MIDRNKARRRPAATARSRTSLDLRTALVIGVGVAAAALAANCAHDESDPAQDAPVSAATAVATDLDGPADAVPSPDAASVYFIARDGGEPAVFQVAASGGATTVLFAGPPLANPRGIVASADGTKLYI